MLLGKCYLAEKINCVVTGGITFESTTYKQGLAHGIARTYWEEGDAFEEAKFKYGTPKYMIIYNEDGSISEQKGWIDKKIIERIVG